MVATKLGSSLDMLDSKGRDTDTWSGNDKNNIENVKTSNEVSLISMLIPQTTKLCICLWGIRNTGRVSLLIEGAEKIIEFEKEVKIRCTCTKIRP